MSALFLVAILFGFGLGSIAFGVKERDRLPLMVGLAFMVAAGVVAYCLRDLS